MLLFLTGLLRLTWHLHDKKVRIAPKMSTEGTTLAMTIIRVGVVCMRDIADGVDIFTVGDGASVGMEVAIGVVESDD